MAMNPVYNLQMMLNHVSRNYILDELDYRTETRFADYCVSNAKDDENLEEVRRHAIKTFKWWNPQAWHSKKHAKLNSHRRKHSTKEIYTMSVRPFFKDDANKDKPRGGRKEQSRTAPTQGSSTQKRKANKAQHQAAGKVVR